MSASDATAPAPRGEPAPVLEVRRLSKTFPGTKALSNLDFTLAPGEIRALLGGNGSGKSTFIKILSGYHRPDPGGEVLIGGEPLDFGHPTASHRAGARFVHQDLGLVDDSSILDNIALEHGFPTRFGTIRTAQARKTVEAALQQVGLTVDPETPIRDLAAAQKTGVALARALATTGGEQVRLLVLDEPTATLPETEVDGLLEMVRTVAAGGVGVIYVTHRLEEVFQVASQATVLRNGEHLVTTPISGLSRDELLHHLVGAELDEVRNEAAALPSEHGEPVLRVRNLSAGRLRDVSFEVRPGDVVGLAGVTGSGRETVNSAIFGGVVRDGGEVVADGVTLKPERPDCAIAAGVAFLTPDRKRLGGLMDLTARENVSISDVRPFWRMPVLRRKAEAADTLKWFESLQVHPPGATETKLLGFSGGNQQKLLLAKWLRLNPKVLLLDEPTQGVDIGAKAVIHHRILSAAAEGMAVLVSSVDMDELAALCHRVLVFRNGRLAATLTGDRVTEPNISRESLASDVTTSDDRSVSVTSG